MTHRTNNTENNIHTEQKIAHNWRQLHDVPVSYAAQVKES